MRDERAAPTAALMHVEIPTLDTPRRQLHFVLHPILVVASAGAGRSRQ
jgi:hypothetical protein